MPTAPEAAQTLLSKADRRRSFCGCASNSFFTSERISPTIIIRSFSGVSGIVFLIVLLPFRVTGAERYTSSVVAYDLANGVLSILVGPIDRIERFTGDKRNPSPWRTRLIRDAPSEAQAEKAYC
jgi:hypothetical protein